MTDRIPVNMLDPGAASDGQGPIYDAASGRVVWGGGSSPTGGAVAVEDDGTQILAAASRLNFAGAGVSVTDAGGGEATVTIQGGGGSGSGGTVLLDNGQTVPEWETANSATAPLGAVVFMKAAASTRWTFSGGLSALPTGWSRRGVSSETFDSAGMATSVASGQGYSVPIPDGNGAGDFTVEIEVVSGVWSGIMQGLIIATGTGSGASAVTYSAPAGVLAAGVSSWSYSSTFQGGGGTPAYPLRLRLRKAGTTFYASMSTNSGTTWTSEVGTSNTNVPTTLGFGSIYGAASSMKVSYVRYTPVSAGGSGLKGWWDGASIVPF